MKAIHETIEANKKEIQGKTIDFVRGLRFLPRQLEIVNTSPIYTRTVSLERIYRELTARSALGLHTRSPGVGKSRFTVIKK